MTFSQELALVSYLPPTSLHTPNLLVLVSTFWNYSAPSLETFPSCTINVTTWIYLICYHSPVPWEGLLTETLLSYKSCHFSSADTGPSEQGYGLNGNQLWFFSSQFLENQGFSCFHMKLIAMLKFTSWYLKHFSFSQQFTVWTVIVNMDLTKL